ncbi:hypothetical protein ACLOJK_018832, partial [Asimina triloba]
VPEVDALNMFNAEYDAVIRKLNMNAMGIVSSACVRWQGSKTARGDAEMMDPLGSVYEEATDPSVIEYDEVTGPGWFCMT